MKKKALRQLIFGTTALVCTLGWVHADPVAGGGGGLRPSGLSAPVGDPEETPKPHLSVPHEGMETS